MSVLRAERGCQRVYGAAKFDSCDRPSGRLRAKAEPCERRRVAGAESGRNDAP